MRLERLLILAGAGAASLSALVGLVSCLDDPREGEQVAVIDKCDTALLSTDPANAEATLNAYVKAADALNKQAVASEAALRDACNAINQELKLPTGADALNACGPIRTRLQGILRNEAPAPPGAFTVTHFVEMFFPKSCKVTPGARESCLAACAGPCDTTKCEPGKVSGTCNGECLGTCTMTGPNVPCVGTCAGETLEVANSPCNGECVGTCESVVWTGACTGSCKLGFFGSCEGTCTGRCVVGTDAVNAGSLYPDGGLPVLQAADAPPGGKDGNCQGTCIGMCSKGANGECKASCLTYDPNLPPVGTFQAGYCGTAGVSQSCNGSCRSPENGSVTACNGACTQLGKPQCDGVCRTAASGGCNGTVTNGVCEGTLACGQSAQCNNACEALTKLTMTCDEPTVGSFILAMDLPLYNAIVKHAGKLGKAVNWIAEVRAAYGFIGTTQLGDFTGNPLNLRGDLLRVCVEEGRKNVVAADALITAAGNANPIVYRKVTQ